MDKNSKYQGTSASAIRSHYDRGTDFYRVWLDESLTYSCALWEGENDTLEASQLCKLDFHLREVGAAGTQRLLDVGSGWGSLLRRAVYGHGVGHAVGLTLSRDQYEWVGAWNDPRIEVRLENWIDHRPEAPYDAITCIGALEHFAKVGQNREERVKAYRGFFSFCHKALKTGGAVSLQTIAFGTLRELPPFISSKIWPESNLPRPSEIIEASDRLFEVETFHNHRADYARTCTEWADRLRRGRARALAYADPQVVDDYERFLRMSAKAFQMGALVLLRITLRRVGPS